jgi:general secretion pathway protein L
MIALAYGGVFLALAAGILKYWNQQVTLDLLEVQIAATAKKAQEVRSLVNQLQETKTALLRLRIRKSEGPGLLEIWEETTRILPPHSWLTDFRLSEVPDGRGALINLTGLSNAAPSLVGVFDRSPTFFDAVLTAPVSIDPAEGRERFALQAKVKFPQLVKEASR